MAPCAPQALQDLKRFGIAVSEWPAPNPQPAYGEKLVHAVMAALDETRPDVLVMPAPDEGDAGQRALALSCLEAARRTSHLACAWISPAAADAPAAGPWQWATLHGGDGDAALLALVSGVHAEPAEPHPHEPPAPGTALVSVIVRSMDRPSLAAALDSVVLQTYRPIELVVVNALGQGHRPLPQRCGGLPVVAVAAPDGQPLLRAQAANRGLAAAAGQLLLFLDDDDLLLPDHVSRLAAALRARSEAPAAFADVAQGRLQGGNWQPVPCFDAGFAPVRLLLENYLPIHGVMFRRTLPGAAPRFDEDFDLFEDWDFWLQLAEHGAFVHVPGVSARYLVSDGQQSDVFTGSAAAQAARDRLVEKWRQHGGPQRYAAALQRLQRLYREASQAQAQVQLLRTGEADLKAVVAAREVEISNAARTVGGLEAIVAAREGRDGSGGGPFRSLFDFCARVDRQRINKRAVEALIKAGAFDALHPEGQAGRAALLASVGLAFDWAETQAANALQGGLFDFGDTHGSSTQEPALVHLPAWDVRERLVAEKAALGFYLSGHLFDACRDEVRRFARRAIAELVDSREPQLLAGIVTDPRTAASQRGRVVIFKLDDGSEAIEAVANEEIFEGRGDLAREDQLIIVQGKLQPDRFSGGLRLNVAQVWDLPAARARFGRYMAVDIDGVLPPVADVLRLWPARRIDSEHGPLLQGLQVRLRLQRREATAELDLGDDARFWPSDEALGRWRSIAHGGAATVVYE